ncbi:MAG: diguanylate cyclase domain-containing protein [Bacilli bacterium]
MKKRNNKLIILVLIGIIFAVLLGIFILNYSKDDSSFSILEKKWINDNTSNVLDVSVYNNIPVFGKNGKGVVFDLLDEFTNTYGINFNKVSYLKENSSNLKDIAFKIIDSNIDITENDILLYEDNYVLISKENNSIDRISDMSNIETLVLSSDVGIVSSYLIDAKDVSYVPKASIDDIETSINNGEAKYALIPYNMYIDYILENDWNILFHLNDLTKKYVLSIKDKTFLNIMKKYYMKYSNENQVISYRNNFLDEFFLNKNITDADRNQYNSNPYNVGYITYMPFEGQEEGDFVGTLSNYLSEFEDIYNVDFKLTLYNNIGELKKALSAGELDLAFANFDTSGLNIDTIYTASPFKEEYVILAKDAFVVNSIKSLKNKEVLGIKDSYINNLATSNGIDFKSYNNTDDLLRNIGNNSVLVIDRDTYDYYKTIKFSDYNELYRGVLPNEYRFVIRDVDKNAIFAEMFSYYVMSSNYDSVRYKYNTNSNIYDFNLLFTFLISIFIILFVIFLIFIIKKKKNKELSLRNNDKLKYIDAMTSLKNRTYLNCKIKEWDDNVIYPQAFVVVDLNNIKYINDNHGHEEGDTVIKKAASILIVNQEANTDIIRTDGNEFLIYMVGYSEKDVISYTRKIYKELKELPYGFGAAIGYSMIMDDVKTVDDAINEATLDMRNKKEN